MEEHCVQFAIHSCGHIHVSSWAGLEWPPHGTVKLADTVARATPCMHCGPLKGELCSDWKRLNFEFANGVRLVYP